VRKEGLSHGWFSVPISDGIMHKMRSNSWMTDGHFHDLFTYRDSFVELKEDNYFLNNLYPDL
jgi:hypothetical protein